MSHEHHDDPTVMFTQEYWDDRYGSTDAVWSGNANPQLVAQVADLTPGTALDVGSGEGGDAIWLATRGWQVTAVDVSPVGLARSAALAAAQGDEVAARITWQQADLLTWDPAPARFDLVSAQFMYLHPRTALDTLHRRLAAAVTPGGTLLIVGHHPSDLETSIGRHGYLEFFYTAEAIAAGLDPAQWSTIETSTRAREAVDPDGQTITINDTVLSAVRGTR